MAANAKGGREASNDPSFRRVEEGGGGAAHDFESLFDDDDVGRQSTVQPCTSPLCMIDWVLNDRPRKKEKATANVKRCRAAVVWPMR